MSSWYTRAARQTRSRLFVRRAPLLSILSLVREWRRQRRLMKEGF